MITTFSVTILAGMAAFGGVGHVLDTGRSDSRLRRRLRLASMAGGVLIVTAVAILSAHGGPAVR
jgi:hypothetical protein